MLMYINVEMPDMINTPEWKSLQPSYLYPDKIVTTH